MFLTLDYVPFWRFCVVHLQFSWTFCREIVTCSLILNFIQGLDVENGLNSPFWKVRNEASNSCYSFSPVHRVKGNQYLQTCHILLSLLSFYYHALFVQGVSNDRFLKNGLKYSQSPSTSAFLQEISHYSVSKNPWISSDIFMDVLYL